MRISGPLGGRQGDLQVPLDDGNPLDDGKNAMVGASWPLGRTVGANTARGGEPEPYGRRYLGALERFESPVSRGRT